MNLFIIGNGFDIYHNLPTKYSDFRDYLINKYPGADEYDEGVPDLSIEDDIDCIKSVGYISKIIDGCGGEDWSDLESYLSNDIFDMICDDFEPITLDTDDKDLFRIAEGHEYLSQIIKNVFPQIKDLFCDWIYNSLGVLNYSEVENDKKITRVLLEGNRFLSFNYTLTLEKVYGKHNVCHIHGSVLGSKENIYFGHGDDNDAPENLCSIGADYNFNELKRNLLKNTDRALEKQYDFFNSLNNVESIHSFGFSLSDVDMIYIEKIAEKSPGVTWLLNNYDSTDTDKREKLEKLGFIVQIDDRW